MSNKKISKKAQLSIETMIIYGLIALVALSAVAALIYFDVLNLGRYLPDSCSIGGTGDLKCEEMKVSSNGNVIELGVRNVAQKPVEGLSITISEPSKIHLLRDVTATHTGTIPPGEIVSITFTLDAADGEILQGQVFEGSLFTSYQYTGGAITQEATGKIRVKAS